MKRMSIIQEKTVASLEVRIDGASSQWDLQRGVPSLRDLRRRLDSYRLFSIRYARSLDLRK